MSRTATRMRLTPAHVVPPLMSGIVCLIVATSGCRDSAPVTASPSTAGAPGASHQGAVSLADTAARFAEVTPQTGIALTYRNDMESGHYVILESLGGGAALFDYDADGRTDVLFAAGGKFGDGPSVRGLPAVLYRQGRVWQFEPATEARVNQAAFYSHGAAAADFDGDGFVDVLITGYGGLLLWHNNGDGTFIETAHASGLTDDAWSSSAAWGDVDGDGCLDLYVAHYVNWSFENNPFCQGPKPGEQEICSPRRFEPLPHVFYSSNRDGTFRDASQHVGLRSDGKGLGVVMADVDLDGHIDIYVGNDTVPNFLYRNDGEGKLLDLGLMSGTSLSDRGTPDGSMGVDVGDFNLDGLPDIWVANYEQESFALYRNEGRCFFQHVSQSTGVTAIGALFVGWGTAFLDFDRDGDEDIVAANGHVIRYPENAPLRQLPLLLENREGRRFANVAPAAGEYFTQAHMGRGLAVGDVDDDGRIDIVICHTNEPAAILANESADKNAWLGLRLIGTHSNRDAIGAHVTVVTAEGKRVTRQVKNGGSYASTSDKRLHFGIGESAGLARVEVRWPSGGEQVLTDVELNRYVDVVEAARAESQE